MLGCAIVLFLNCPRIVQEHETIHQYPRVTWGYPSFKPHVSLSYFNSVEEAEEYAQKVELPRPPSFPILFDGQYEMPLNNQIGKQGILYSLDGSGLSVV